LWVPEKQIADDLILDFQEDRSSDSFVRILGSRKAIDNENEYLVQVTNTLSNRITLTFYAVGGFVYSKLGEAIVVTK
jgi:hypothetical protein